MTELNVFSNNPNGKVHSSDHENLGVFEQRWEYIQGAIDTSMDVYTSENGIRDIRTHHYGLTLSYNRANLFSTDTKNITNFDFSIPNNNNILNNLKINE
ncbi:hypothetical protein [Marinicellulosiphila megalodicopiae]|uniref:hypothetical protein n=1 Tax=Marinicellulosiphila megalodicopiae TaxID=2724896 RepID=UPI003BB1D7CC